MSLKTEHRTPIFGLKGTKPKAKGLFFLTLILTTSVGHFQPVPSSLFRPEADVMVQVPTMFHPGPLLSSVCFTLRPIVIVELNSSHIFHGPLSQTLRRDWTTCVRTSVEALNRGES